MGISRDDMGDAIIEALHVLGFRHTAKPSIPEDLTGREKQVCKLLMNANPFWERNAIAYRSREPRRPRIDWTSPSVVIFVLTCILLFVLGGFLMQRFL